ncbi:hypothetical protein [Cytobacillus sp. IB215316]|uniref:hypothetical protein n=1 Tax=Cytobacillus sp. IB215316 TaxID=3097354 RepID=UPI002A133519|nr:hypothetical protein [Cytobacillus sp. IB215316]MDX8360758.1 hypothetical protein [Cytobacillus sp. IB215316]
MVRAIIVFGCLCIVLLASTMVYKFQDNKIDPVLISMKEYINVNDEFYDPLNDLDVASINDIGVEKKGAEFKVYYGSRVFTIDDVENIPQEAIDILRGLGLTFHTLNNGEIILKYNGEKVDEFVL